MGSDGRRTRRALSKARRSRCGSAPVSSAPRTNYWTLDPETAPGRTVEKCRDLIKGLVQNGIKFSSLERVLDKRFARSLYQPILANMRRTWRPNAPVPVSS